MPFTLVLAEKPSVGRDIAKVLNCRTKGNGYMEGKNYIVTWALGHLVTLADPEEYDDRYKTWRLEDLPMLPDKMKLVVIKESGRQYKVVKELLHRKDVGEIVIATDAGREGELVARWILEKSQVKKKLKRLWISSVTDKAIKQGFDTLKDGKDYENLYHSAQARAEADWYVGINATRALTCKYNAQLSCGRVQTPTLAMIKAREDEIKSFVPKKYYGICAEASGLKMTWQSGRTKDTKIFQSDECDEIISRIKGKDAKITDVQKTNKKVYAPLLYDLTELQRDANRLYDFSAKETLSIMQRLYENYKILTYPRTDSRYITKDVAETLKERIHACGVGRFAPFAQKVLRYGIKTSGSFVNDGKVTDHHAIIPTEQKVPDSLGDRERKIYDLVIKRFFSVLYPPYIYDITKITAQIGADHLGAESFTAKFKAVVSPGWKEIYESSFFDEEDEDSEILREAAEDKAAEYKVGAVLKVDAIKKTSGETKPPSLFNEGTLLSAMENPAKYMSNKDKGLVKTLGETGGLGTVATRADIIEKLFNTFLVEKKGKDIYTTSKGRQLLDLVPDELKSPELTARWEQKLQNISKGQLDKNDFVGNMKSYAREIVGEIKVSSEVFKHDNITRTKCPVCGKYMLEVNGKKGKMLVCQDRQCGYRQVLSHLTNARCPNCHKRMEIHGTGESQIFVCSCGFREKLSVFLKNKKTESGSVSKRDVAVFMKKQDKVKNEPLNSALADALSKLKNKQ